MLILLADHIYNLSWKKKKVLHLSGANQPK